MSFVGGSIFADLQMTKIVYPMLTRQLHINRIGCEVGGGGEIEVGFYAWAGGQVWAVRWSMRVADMKMTAVLFVGESCHPCRGGW